MRRSGGFTFVELLIALVIGVMFVPSLMYAKNYSEEELAVAEAENLVRWLRWAFAKADAAGQFFEVEVPLGARNSNVFVYWLDNIEGTLSKKTEIYSSGGNAFFMSLSSGVTLVRYSPVGNSNDPFGMTVGVYGKSGRAKGVVRHAIISRFGRVRVSKENLGE